MKIRPVEAELPHADRRTDRHDEANSRPPQFCESAPKNALKCPGVTLKITAFDGNERATFRDVKDCQLNLII